MLGKRVYCIYGYNEGQLQYSDPETGDFFDLPRGDMQLEDGFCMKYSDVCKRKRTANSF